MEDGGRDVVRPKRGVQRRVVTAYPGVEDILLRGGDHQARVRVPHRPVAIRIALPGRPPDVPVGMRDQAVEARLPDLQLGPVAAYRGLKAHLGGGQGAVDIEWAGEGIGQLRQDLFDLARADVGLAAAQAIHVMGHEAEFRCGRNPIAQPVEADGHEFGVKERTRGQEAAHQRVGLTHPAGRGLVRRVDRRRVAGVERDLPHLDARSLVGVEERGQDGRAFPEPAPVCGQRRQPVLQVLAGCVPVRRAGVDACQVPGLLDRHLRAQGQASCFSHRFTSYHRGNQVS